MSTTRAHWFSTNPDKAWGEKFFLTHAERRALLERITGHPIRALAMPGSVMRLLGRGGDLVQRFGRDAALTWEAAEILTRSVPIDDRVARAALGREPIPAEQSYRDLIRGMVREGHWTQTSRSPSAMIALLGGRVSIRRRSFRRDMRND